MTEARVAYFTMEIALEPNIPTYSGGLGALAGDTIRSAADLRLPMVAVSLLHRKGYFTQSIDAAGWQSERPAEWDVSAHVKELSPRVSVTLDGHTVTLRAWQYTVRGVEGHEVPVILLDADLPENEEWFRTLTDTLYGGDYYYRICQEGILGIGGVRMLRALGLTDIQRFHMNEGHASLLAVELLREEAAHNGREDVRPEDVEAVRPKCIFTTHTPVAAGHDQFDLDMARRVLGLGDDLMALGDVFHCDHTLNMTHLALSLSHYVNGVAKRHGEVSRVMFPHYTIDAITNGVHATTWASPPFAELFDRHISGWRTDNFMLRYALNIPREEVWDTHMAAKRRLFEYVNQRTDTTLDPRHLTLGFARRMAPYKRGNLLLSDVERMKSIASQAGPFQIVYAGKAHPGDSHGKDIIHAIFEASRALEGHVPVVYLENYDVEVAQYLTAGVDVWVNTPQRPLEASGTSGMKAALNGVPSLSVLDGWWVEGHIEGVTGWSIGAAQRSNDEGLDWRLDADSLYGKLEHVIIPLVNRNRHRYIEVMRHCMALNGSFFNTQRMAQQYVLRAYFL